MCSYPSSLQTGFINLFSFRWLQLFMWISSLISFPLPTQFKLSSLAPEHLLTKMLVLFWFMFIRSYSVAAVFPREAIPHHCTQYGMPVWEGNDYRWLLHHLPAITAFPGGHTCPHFLCLRSTTVSAFWILCSECKVCSYCSMQSCRRSS